MNIHNYFPELLADSHKGRQLNSLILYITKKVKIKFWIGFIFTTKFNRKEIQLVSKIISTLSNNVA